MRKKALSKLSSLAIFFIRSALEPNVSKAACLKEYPIIIYQRKDFADLPHRKLLYFVNQRTLGEVPSVYGNPFEQTSAEVISNAGTELRVS